MAEFTVDTDLLRSCGDEIDGLRSTLNGVAMKLSGMQLGSIIQIKASTALLGRITDCQVAVLHQSGDLKVFAERLDAIAEQYEAAERKLKEPKTEDPKSTAVDEILDLLVKLFGKTTPIAALITAFYHMFNGAQGDGKSWLNALKSLSSAIGDIGKCVADKKTTAEWKEVLLGTKNTADGMSGTGFSDFLEDEISKYKVDASSTTGDKIKVGTKWASALLTVALTAVDNVQEFDGNFSNSRFWAETATESAIKIGKDMLIKAGAAAVLMAVTGGAPAVGVALLAGAVTVVVDWAAELVTGKDFTEACSDWLLDHILGSGDSVSTEWQPALCAA